MAEQHHFPKEEEKILELWRKLDAFKSCLKQSEGKPRLVIHSKIMIKYAFLTRSTRNETFIDAGRKSCTR